MVKFGSCESYFISRRNYGKIEEIAPEGKEAGAEVTML
jgi:hypothetical protein